MPLRQSTLRFGSRASKPTATLIDESTVVDTRSFAEPPIEDDTIVVDLTNANPQLPTPSESATDVSSESSQLAMRDDVPKRRVSSRGRKSVFREDTNTSRDKAQSNERSFSGTSSTSNKTHGSFAGSNSTLVERSSTALNDSHAYDADAIEVPTLIQRQPFELDGRELEHKVSLLELERDQDGDAGSVITVNEESEDDQMREERRAAKKAKMAENAKKWEERKKVAENNATRKSHRASIASKANAILDNIVDTVLGKRTRNATDNEVGKSDPKRQRTQEDQEAEEPRPKILPTRRQKKWLVSGLYAGQPRMFDARFTENKNKRKSKATEETQLKDNSVIPLPMFAGERLLQHGRDFKLPFDVFSPLPAGQPKPDEWKKVNKNVFVGDAADEWRTNKFVEHSKCICRLPTGCDQDCMNRYMYYECDERNCSFGWDEQQSCRNRAFDELKRRTKVGGKYNVGVEVIKTADRGYGVRSNRTFMPNQIIVEYTGEIITQDECERRMRTIYKENECYYLMLFDQNMIIDATRGSIARFVNHSCEPNCRMEKWTVGGKPRMALFAGEQGIMTGDELTYDYNFDPYSQKNVQECRCGAKTCRGILGPKPKPEAKRSSPEDETAKKKKTSKLSNTKRKVIEVLEDGANHLNKKRKPNAVSGKKAQSPVKSRASIKSPKRVVLVKKSTSRKVSMPKTAAKPAAKAGRSGAKLKKMITSAKKQAGSVKNRRAVSASSTIQPLLGKKKAAVSRSSSLKEKAKSVVKSVRGKGNTIAVAA